ncbi:MAG: glycosyl hydrolase [Gemmatimonadetes bacterium]|nr:glycosyl hydrolase [Gemmatimonadota bacterium]
MRRRPPPLPDRLRLPTEGAITVSPRAAVLPAAATSGRSLPQAVALAPSLLLLPPTLPGLCAQEALPDGSARYVVGSPGAGRFALAADGQVAALRLDEGEWPGVIRAANDLKADLGRVTKMEPAVAVGGAPGARQLVLIGTMGRSATIDRLVAAGKIDGRALAGKWETFVTQIVANPLPGVDRALVVAGSDKRGTIYGIYDISAQIGVSPWYWWADVPVPQQSALYVLPGRHTQGTPAVKYRGIFINDEAPAMSGWTREYNGGFNSRLYTRVFELILRLKGNFLWPAMWGSAFNLDDPQNPILADEYGIVMSTSHHEPMQRAQQEWRRVGTGEWNYERNDSVLRAFWRAGIRNKGDREGVVTLAMRGDGDMPMTQGANIALLERIVADQRQIIEEVTGKPAAATPQVWALYKEVQEYYDKGMRVPDDVTLLFSDDNWGDIRRLPSPQDRARAGGFGIYYHFDYVGGPRNSKWLNKNPIPRIWEQLQLAHEYGANRIWVVNVGDLKPMEYPIQFFLDYAWNPSRIPAARLPEYARLWAQQQFGADHAAEIATVVTTYLKYAGRRTAELLDTVTFSLSNFREAETMVADWRALEQRAFDLAKQLPATHQDAYYQLVLHPIQALGNVADLYVTVARNRTYAQQQRAATNAMAARARALFERDAQISAFYNDTLAGGKWRHMMDQTHIGYTYWQEPPRNAMPRVDVLQVPAAAEMAVAVVEQNRAAPPRRPGMPGAPGGMVMGPPSLPAFDVYLQQTYHLDVYNRGRTPFRFTAEVAEPWLIVSPASGTVEQELRLAVSVDWSRAPAGRDTAAITITGPNGSRSVVRAPLFNPASPGRDFAGFVQSGSFVSMEAEHFARAVGGQDVAWEVIPDFGRTLSGVHPTPVTTSSRTPGGTSPHLQYRVFVFDTGTVKVHAYISPTWDFRGGTGLRYAVSIDDETPRIVNIHADSSSTGRTDGNRAWEQGAASAIKVHVSEHRVASPGDHVVRYWLVDPGVVLQKLVVSFGDLPETYLGPPESFRGSGPPRERSARPRRAGRELPARPWPATAAALCSASDQTRSRLSTAVTPGESRATHSAASRSASVSTQPVRMTR